MSSGDVHDDGDNGGDDNRWYRCPRVAVSAHVCPPTLPIKSSHLHVDLQQCTAVCVPVPRPTISSLNKFTHHHHTRLLGFTAYSSKGCDTNSLDSRTPSKNEQELRRRNLVETALFQLDVSRFRGWQFQKTPFFLCENFLQASFSAGYSAYRL